MATGVNRVPRGLNQFLSLSVQGDYPKVLIEGVQPTVDLLPFYSAGRGLEYVQATLASAPSPGAQLLIAKVPNGEQWLMVGASSFLTNLEVFQVLVSVSINISDDGVTGVQTLTTNPTTGIFPGGTLRAGILFPRPVILDSGSNIFLNLDNIGSGFVSGVSMTGYASFYRLKY